MPKTEAEVRANKKYLEKFDSILLRIKPELKTKIVGHAKKTGESVNSLIIRAINELFEREE